MADETWLEANRRDSGARVRLHHWYLATADAEKAKANLVGFLAASPESVFALNEMAWMLYGEGAYARASFYARAAYDLAADNPAVLDTLGAILLARHQAKEALEVLARADKLLPNHSDISLHLAEAQWQTGDTDAARETLRRFLDATRDVEQRAKAESLLRKLGR